jgi:hypothetical protein
MIKYILFILLSCIAILGCAMNNGQIVGSWILENASRSKLAENQRNAKATIRFDADGRFAAYEIPEDLLYSGGSGLVSGEGTWRLVQERKQIQLNFDKITDGAKDTVPYGTQLFISRSLLGLGLYYYQGDPDLGRRIIYNRK